MRRGGQSVVPNTTDCSVVYHPSAFDLCLCVYAGNEGWRGGRGGNYSLTTELGRTVRSPTDLRLYRLCVTLTAWEYVQVQGCGQPQSLESHRMTYAGGWGTSGNSIRAMHL